MGHVAGGPTGQMGRLWKVLCPELENLTCTVVSREQLKDVREITTTSSSTNSLMSPKSLESVRHYGNSSTLLAHITFPQPSVSNYAHIIDNGDSERSSNLFKVTYLGGEPELKGNLIEFSFKNDQFGKQRKV